MRFRSRKPEDFSAEIEAHLQLEVDRLREQGLSEEEARHAALRTFGNVVRSEERFYESGRWFWWELFLQNLRIGARMLMRTPGSTAVAVLTLALGIGANTAIFSLLNAVLLRHLPVERPEELVLFGSGKWRGDIDDLPDRSWQLFSYPFFREFRAKNQVFSDVAAIDSILLSSRGRVAGAQDLEKIDTELVSGTFFRTLGVNPIFGRVFSDADDRIPGGHSIAVASYSWCQRRLGASPKVIGSTVTINSTVYTIVGVTPPDFFGAIVGEAPDLWIPLAMEKEVSPEWNGLNEKLFQSLYLIARRKPGVSIDRASVNTNLLFRQILDEYVGPRPSPKQVASIRHASINVTSAVTGVSALRRFFTPLKTLMAVVGVVLLIACANVANLLLARAATRRREMAIRMSIGAERGRLIRQLLVESTMLGAMGALLGMLLAWAGIRALAGMAAQPIPIRITPDAAVLCFTMAITMATVLLFGMVPAFSATRLELTASLKDGRGAGTEPVRSRLARGLIVAQVALSLVLLAGAGLFLRSLDNLMHADLGFDKQNALIFGIDASSAGYRPDAHLENIFQRVESRVAMVPGVSSAAFAFTIFGGAWSDPIKVPGRPASDRDPEAIHNVVGPRYFAAMRMPVVLGRGLTPQDDAAAHKVAVINETMAHRFFPGQSPLGRMFSIGDDREWQNIEIVGVVKDATYMDIGEKRNCAAFYPHSQHPRFLSNFIARYSGDGKQIVPLVRQAIRAVDPNLPVTEASTLARMIDDSVVQERLTAELSTLFGLLAGFLAAIGIYGVMSCGIARRTNEFGVRMALGARSGDVLRMVLRETFAMVLIGASIGLALTLACSRLLVSMLYMLKPFDPLALGAAVLAIGVIALVAGWLPARRATRIDPLAALRCE